MFENDAGREPAEGKNRIRVVVCRPGERAETAEIEENLKAMQAVVGGLIQELFPFQSNSDERHDSIALICNEEGKLLRLRPSRAIYDETGRIRDVIAGTFFICYAPVESEKFHSLPTDLEEEYLEKFRDAEMFYRTDEGIFSLKYRPAEPVKGKEMER